MPIEDLAPRRFDVILTNPPFQDVTRRGKTPHKLWIDFTLASFNRFLADGGLLCQVSPASFQSPSSKILALMKAHATAWIDFDTARHFPGIGSSFACYAIYKRPSSGTPTRFYHAGRETDIELGADVFYLPNDGPEGLPIHHKVIFAPRPRLGVEWDYVTAHNVLVHSSNTLSRERTARHVHEVLHTNSQRWWSSIRQDFAPARKVMWSRSGYTRPFYDPGTLGVTDMGYFVRVASATAGENLAHNMNLALMRYIYATARWSGFGNEKVFAALPDLPRDRRLSDAELYALFGLTAGEIEHVEGVLAGAPGAAPAGATTPDLSGGSDELWALVAASAGEHGYMAGAERSEDRIRATAEVFTPTGLVIEMLRRIPLELFGPGRTVLDPACGDGQFLVAALWVKMIAFGMSRECALADIRGIDIMADNVELCRQRLGGGTIVVGDAMGPAW